MRGTIKDMTRAGLVSQLCRYHDEVEGAGGPWDKTIEFAMREFRDLDSLTIGKLIEHCRGACLAGRIMSEMPPDSPIDPNIIPKLKE